MIDERSLYINQILNHYRKSALDDNTYYTVKYRRPDSFINEVLSHNDGLDIVRDYIKDLEKKIEELQYVEKIIKSAKENDKCKE